MQIDIVSYGSEANPRSPRRSGLTREGRFQANKLRKFLGDPRYDEVLCAELTQAVFAANNICPTQVSKPASWLYPETGSPELTVFELALQNLGGARFEKYALEMGKMLDDFGWEASFALRSHTAFQPQSKRILVVTHPILVQAIAKMLVLHMSNRISGRLVGCEGYRITLERGIEIEDILDK